VYIKIRNQPINTRTLVSWFQKNHKNIATRCHILRLKCTNFDSWRLSICLFVCVLDWFWHYMTDKRTENQFPPPESPQTYAVVCKRADTSITPRVASSNERGSTCVIAFKARHASMCLTPGAVGTATQDDATAPCPAAHLRINRRGSGACLASATRVVHCPERSSAAAALWWRSRAMGERAVTCGSGKSGVMEPTDKHPRRGGGTRTNRRRDITPPNQSSLLLYI